VEYVTVKELARELGLDRSNMRKYVLAAGFDPVKVRTPESKGQLTLALSEDEAELVRAKRESEGYLGIRAVGDDGKGSFYIIQLIPELIPGRVKLGFAGDVGARLRAHRTAAPTAELVRSWPCRKAWEVAAIASVTREGCEFISNEVFDCDDLNTLVSRADDFFALMPGA